MNVSAQFYAFTTNNRIPVISFDMGDDLAATLRRM